MCSRRDGAAGKGKQNGTFTVQSICDLSYRWFIGSEHVTLWDFTALVGSGGAMVAMISFFFFG